MGSLVPEVPSALGSHVTFHALQRGLPRRRGGLEAVVDHSLESSGSVLPEHLTASGLSLNCLEAALMDVTLHVSTMKSGGPLDLPQPAARCLRPINQR